MANFGETPLLTVGDHSPVRGNDQVDKHEQLKAVVKEVPKHNVLVVILDFNVYLDKSIAQYSYLELCYSNDILINDFIQELTLFAVNTSFQKKPAQLRKKEKERERESKTQVAFIMSKTWKSSIYDYQIQMYSVPLILTIESP